MLSSVGIIFSCEAGNVIFLRRLNPLQNNADTLIYAAVTITAVALMTIGILGCYPIAALATMPIAVSYAFIGAGSFTLFIEVILHNLKKSALPKSATPPFTLVKPHQNTPKKQYQPLLAEPCTPYYDGCDRRDVTDKNPSESQSGLRAMQTCLSAIGKVPSLPELSDELSSKYNYGRSFLDSSSDVFHKYLDDKNIPNTLLYYKTSSMAQDPILEFSLLRDQIVQHFKGQKTPVMIDNKCHSCVIIGADLLSEGQMFLRLANPAATEKDHVVFDVTLDAQGNQMSSTQKGRDTLDINFISGWIMIFPKRDF